MWGLLLPHCNDCASKLLPTRANIGTQQCIVLADICVLANWWTRQIHAVLADFCVLVYWWTGELDITLQHWQIHAALVAISQSWWRGREGRGLCFLITSKCTPCRWMLMIAAIMRWRKNLRLQNWCKGLLVLVIVIKRTVFLKKHLERICYVTMRKYWPWFQFSLSPQCCIGSFQLLPIYVTQCNSQQTNRLSNDGAHPSPQSSLLNCFLTTH